MEKKLVKGALYSFLIGLALAFLYYPDTVNVQQSPGLYSELQLPMREYMIKLLKFAVKLSLAVTFVLWVKEIGFRRDSGEPSFLLGMVKGFAAVSVLIVIVWIGMTLVGRWIS